MDQFQELLWDLGETLQIPLHVDKNNACQILFNGKIAIHMEMAKERDALLIGAFIGEIPPGRFREDVLRECLKINATPNPLGVLAYIEKTNRLILQNFLPSDLLNSEKLAEYLEEFVPEAESWQEAINRGQAAPDNYLKTHGKSTLFKSPSPNE